MYHQKCSPVTTKTLPSLRKRHIHANCHHFIASFWLLCVFAKALTPTHMGLISAAAILSSHHQVNTNKYSHCCYPYAHPRWFLFHLLHLRAKTRLLHGFGAQSPVQMCTAPTHSLLSRLCLDNLMAKGTVRDMKVALWI